MSSPCRFNSDGTCLKGLFGGRPSRGICLLACKDYDGPARGRGDRIKKGIELVTLGMVKPCGKCGERQIDQNRRHPSVMTKRTLDVS